jgi:hypothetical protein
MSYIKRIVAIGLALGMVVTFTATSTGEASEATSQLWTGSTCIPDCTGPTCCA